MAYKRDKREEAPKIDYQPYAWRLVSGDLEKDAIDVVCLPTREFRLREMRRLKQIHGRDYAKDIERRVLALWPKRDEFLKCRLSARVV